MAVWMNCFAVATHTHSGMSAIATWAAAAVAAVVQVAVSGHHFALLMH